MVSSPLTDKFPTSADAYRGGPRTPTTPSRSSFALKSAMKRSSVPNLATFGEEPAPKLLADSSGGSPTQRTNAHAANGLHLMNGPVVKDDSALKTSTEPLAVKPVKSMPNLGAHGAHSGAIPSNTIHAGLFPGHSGNGVHGENLPGRQFARLPHNTADANGRPVHPIQPYPIHSWNQPQPGYPHVGYVPDWDLHAYMTGIPGTGPVLPPNVQQAPPNLVMHNWTPEVAPPIPVEAVPQGFVHSHFAYHPVTGQHCAVWIPAVAQYPSVY